MTMLVAKLTSETRGLSRGKVFVHLSKLNQTSVGFKVTLDGDLP